MDKKKLITCITICVVVFAVGVTIGFFIGKGETQDISAEITSTTAEETTEAPSETEEVTEEETTEETTTKKVEYTEVEEIVYATTNVNIRAGVGTSAEIISALKKGDKIKRIAIGDNGWSKVLYNGKTAYVFSQYLTKTASDGSAVDMCGISNTDANNLTDFLEYIFFYNSKSDGYLADVESYDYKADDAFEKAFATIHSASFYNFSKLFADVYRIYYDYCVIFPSDEDSKTDPRGYWQQYRYVDAEFIDFILENMFNVKPDHSYILKEKGWDGENHIVAYYEDGYYYSDAGDGGDGCGPEVTIKKVEILPDGKYQITVHYRIVTNFGGDGPETVNDGGDINIIAEMKNIDGNSIWSFYEINK